MKFIASQCFDGSQWSSQQSLEFRPEGLRRIAVSHVSDMHESRPCPWIPGMVNVHSHAFQAGFAGLGQARSTAFDDFWSWRGQMYAFLDRLTPEVMYQVARHAYARMLAAGYTSVGEFHYVHHDRGGIPYADRTELANCVIRAARDAGIEICLLLTLYQRGGFDGHALEGPQLRFLHSVDSLLDDLAQLRRRWSHDPCVSFGVAPHSLRAVAPEALRELVAGAIQTNHDIPIHIHVAEQLREVEDCLAATGRRPVEWLLDHVDLGPAWTLIHATHITDAECAAIAQSGATVGLCPTTEADLGDGIFPIERFLAASGQFAIGSDSQITIDPAAELRMLEYTQRLLQRRRAVLASATASTGRRLYASALHGGTRALARTHPPSGDRTFSGWLRLDPDHPAIENRCQDTILDGLIFHDAGSPILETIVGTLTGTSR